MIYFVSGAIVIIILVVFIKLKKDVAKSIATEFSQEVNQPRDFIKQASIWVKPPIELRDYVDENKKHAVDFLINCLSSGLLQERKHASYALGQIGDERLADVFKIWMVREPADDVKEVMRTCQSAIQLAPSDKGFTELQRRKIIDDLYFGKASVEPN